MHLPGQPVVSDGRRLSVRRTLFGVSDDLGAALMRETVRVAKAVRTGLRCDGICVMQTNGEAAGSGCLPSSPARLPAMAVGLTKSDRSDRRF